MGMMAGIVRQWSRAAGLTARPVPTYSGTWSCIRAVSNNSAQSDSSTKTPLKKPKTPQGRFDETEQPAVEKEVLERFPYDINPNTKEKGGPRGPEPTRYGDWERKGRCIDF